MRDMKMVSQMRSIEFLKRRIKMKFHVAHINNYPPVCLSDGEIVELDKRASLDERRLVSIGKKFPFLSFEEVKAVRWETIKVV